MKVPLRFASVVGLIISACMSTGINGSAPDPELQEIAGYRQWHRLTEKPLVVNDFVGGGWAIFVDFGEVPIKRSITTTQIRFPRGLPPGNDEPKPKLHGDSSSFGVVYANDLARSSYSSSPTQTFPVGSILIREKLASPNAEKPQLLTVMIKREKGFNPEGGDWSFLTVDGAGTKVKQRKKKGECLECHQSARARDFVFELK